MPDTRPPMPVASRQSPDASDPMPVACASCGAMHHFTPTATHARLPDGWVCALCASHPAYAKNAQERRRREAEERADAQAAYDDQHGEPIPYPNAGE